MESNVDAANVKLRWALDKEGRGMLGEVVRLGDKGYQVLFREGKEEMPLTVPQRVLDSLAPESGIVPSEMRQVIRVAARKIDDLRRRHHRKRRRY